MNVIENALAKKYATAFLNLYLAFLKEEHIAQFAAIANFLRKQKTFYVALQIPTVPMSTKERALNRIIEAFNLGRLTRRLMFVLLHHGRIEILDNVLDHICYGYKKLHNMQTYKISTSHEITELQKSTITNYLAKLTTENITTDFVVDPNLIMGIRIECATALWERSIRKVLLGISQSMIRKGMP